MHLLGDGYLMVRELALLVDRTGNEPLALWLVKQLYISATDFDAETVYWLYSYGAGVFYVVLRLEIVRGRWLVCGACAQHTFVWLGVSVGCPAGLARKERCPSTVGPIAGRRWPLIIAVLDVQPDYTAARLRLLKIEDRIAE